MRKVLNAKNFELRNALITAEENMHDAEEKYTKELKRIHQSFECYRS